MPAPSRMGSSGTSSAYRPAKRNAAGQGKADGSLDHERDIEPHFPVSADLPIRWDPRALSLRV